MQKLVHFLKNDAQTLPRMLLKIDIEKHYDVLDWNAILDTLINMIFPYIWISLIETCISSANFAFLISGQSSN